MQENLREVVMFCGSRAKNGRKLCPVSLGFSIGVTFALGVLIWSFWAIYNGPTPMMVQYNIPVPTAQDAWMNGLWALIKGFVLGFFIAVFYDLFSCVFSCCRRTANCTREGGCACGCKCCTPNTTNTTTKY